MTEVHPIPQTDPRAGYLERSAAIDAAIARVLAGGQYILGREVEAFEAAFAAWLGLAHGIGVGNGTDALELALRACGIGAGDLVFTVSHTAVATVAAIERAGAIPVLVDIEPGGFTMDPAALARRLRHRRRAGRPRCCRCISTASRPISTRSSVSRAGMACASSRIARRATARSARGRPTGSVRRYRLLQLLSDQEFGRARRCRHGRDQRRGSLPPRRVKSANMAGATAMSAPASASTPGSIRCRRRSSASSSPCLADDNARRQAIAARYDAGLAGLPLALPARPEATHVFHQYVVRRATRPACASICAPRNRHRHPLPAPVHLQPAYRGRLAAGPSGLGETERAARRF